MLDSFFPSPQKNWYFQFGPKNRYTHTYRQANLRHSISHCDAVHCGKKDLFQQRNEPRTTRISLIFQDCSRKNVKGNTNRLSSNKRIFHVESGWVGLSWVGLGEQVSTLLLPAHPPTPTLVWLAGNEEENVFVCSQMVINSNCGVAILTLTSRITLAGLINGRTYPSNEWISEKGGFFMHLQKWFSFWQSKRNCLCSFTKEMTFEPWRLLVYH